MADKVKENKASGYIRMYRSSLYHPALECDDEKFDTFHCWFDLVAAANHTDREIKIRGESFIVKRGQKFTSIRKLAIRWNKSRRSVAGTLKMFENEGMIKVFGTHNGTLITIVKYDTYNPAGSKKRDTEGATENTTGRDTDVTQTINDRSNDYLKNERREGLSPWGGEYE